MVHRARAWWSVRLSLSVSPTHSLTLSLSLSRTHTHTHTQTLSFVACKATAHGARAWHRVPWPCTRSLLSPLCLSAGHGTACPAMARNIERAFFIDNLLVRIHLIIKMIRVNRPCAMRVWILFSREPYIFFSNGTRCHGVHAQGINCISCISQKVSMTLFFESRSPHKFVNLFFILGIIKDKLTDLCWN